MAKIIILDTHPTSYRSYSYNELGLKLKNSLKIIYLSTYSIGSYYDKSFKKIVKTKNNISNNNHQFESLSKNKLPKNIGYSIIELRKLIKKINKNNPKLIIFTSLNHPIFIITSFYLKIFKSKIHLAIRTETDDFSRNRNYFKKVLRNLIYKIIYKPFGTFMPIGIRSYQHYKMHGAKNEEILFLPYVTHPRIKNLSKSELNKRRNNLRNNFSISKNKTVITFCGKLIPKKNFSTIIRYLTKKYSRFKSKNDLFVLIIGSGYQEEMIRDLCKNMYEKTKINFALAGLVENEKLTDYYLASDIFILPSIKLGETWGLVCNEAIECGCSLLVSKFVGCSEDFKSLKRVEVFDPYNFQEFNKKFNKLLKYKNQPKWSPEVSEGIYSMDHLNRKLIKFIKKF